MRGCKQRANYAVFWRLKELDPLLEIKNQVLDNGCNVGYKKAELGPFHLEVSYVFVLHVFEEPELSIGPFGEEFGLEGSMEFLDGHLRARPAIKG